MLRTRHSVEPKNIVGDVFKVRSPFGGKMKISFEILFTLRVFLGFIVFLVCGTLSVFLLTPILPEHSYGFLFGFPFMLLPIWFVVTTVATCGVMRCIDH